MEIYRMQAECLPKIHFVDDAVIRPTFLHKKRKPSEYIMYVVKQGEMYLEEDGIPLSLRTGDVCILDKDRTHVGVKPSLCEYYYVHFMQDHVSILEFQEEGEAVEALGKYRSEALGSDNFSYDKCENNVLYLPKYCHIHSQAVRIKVEELLKMARCENYKSIENYKMICACYIQQAFIEIGRCFLDEAGQAQSIGLPVYYDTVRKIEEWLNQHYDSEITGVLLETVFEYNFDYMNRIFKKVNGQTIFSYLTQTRLEHAKMLLQNTSMKVAEIGKRVGFPDEYYFSRVFKKHIGISPIAYARSKMS